MENTRIIKLLKFLEESPNDPFLIYALATEYNNLGDRGMAQKFYEELINNHPDYVGTYYHLAKFYLLQNEMDKALKTYKDGMAIARSQRDQHAFSELQTAYNQAAGLDYEDD